MRRGELYRIARSTAQDSKRYRVFVIVSRQEFIDSRYSTLVCAAIYTNPQGLTSEVSVGVEEGLKHASCIRCDELVSIRKSELTHYVGSLSAAKVTELNQALRVALDIPDDQYHL
ncbi:MAG: type II toxin-antitoxin system PemK/MazF family toxin [Pyrinomonadaceae bacterium]